MTKQILNIDISVGVRINVLLYIGQVFGYIGLVLGYVAIPYLISLSIIESNLVPLSLMLTGFVIYMLVTYIEEHLFDILKMKILAVILMNIYIGLVFGYVAMPYFISLFTIEYDSIIYLMFLTAIDMLIINILGFYFYKLYRKIKKKQEKLNKKEEKVN
jgi:hypothetical protein